MAVSRTHLIPIQELTPGAVGAIRNQVIKAVVARACKEMHCEEKDLVVRDVQPVTDLQLYSDPGTAATVEEWIYTATNSTGWQDVTGGTTNVVRSMGDERYVALFGVRDMRNTLGASEAASQSMETQFRPSYASLVRIQVGGATKVIWDCTNFESYLDNQVGFCPSAVIIPQNDAFRIDYYRHGNDFMINAAIGIDRPIMFQLVGVTVEKRGRTISP